MPEAYRLCKSRFCQLATNPNYHTLCKEEGLWGKCHQQHSVMFRHTQCSKLCAKVAVWLGSQGGHRGRESTSWTNLGT